MDAGARIGLVGSGHTGVTVAKALAERGHRPVLLDVGETLEDRRQEIVARLGSQSSARWDPHDIEEVARNDTVFGARPMRLAFGSDYVYAADRDFAPVRAGDAAPVPTFARGGFSKVWGAAMLPAADSDMEGWPLRRSDLAPHYRSVLEDLPFSAEHDELARAFPLYASPTGPIELAPIVASFLGSLSRSRWFRNRDDVVFGRARLAVRASDGPDGKGCRYCGFCLSGCVYGSIHTADQDLERLSRDGRLDYRPGHLVIRIDERDDEVEVTCETDAGPRRLRFDRLFLAAGAINTARLVLESRRIYDRPLLMRTTQGFVVPMVRLRGSPFHWPRANTLTGAFLEFKVPGARDRWVHTQIGAANELVLRRLDYRPERGSVRDRALKWMLGRLLVAHCNFHSDHASVYELALSPGGTGGQSVLHVETHPSAEAAATLRRGAARLVRLMARVGVVPLLPFKHGSYDKPMGWHFGGSFPMSRDPRGEFETDTLGRLEGWRRVHIVDSSIFPSLPATTIALPAMANARRIAELVGEMIPAAGVASAGR